MGGAMLDTVTLVLLSVIVVALVILIVMTVR